MIRENLYNEVIVYDGQNMKSTPQSANDLQRAIDDYLSAMKNRS